MTKIGNFKKETLKNGARVNGGHRVKYVSEDKEFVILLTKYGKFQGLYLTYESDGAHIDEERTPAPCAEIAFDSLEDCMKHYKVGEYAEDVKADSKQQEQQQPELTPIEKQWEKLKAKHPDALLLFRCGDFYEAYEDDAKACAEILGITLTRRIKGGKQMAGFPYHALDSYQPKLVRAGKRIAICDQLEAPKVAATRSITELVTPAKKAEKKPAADKIADGKASVETFLLDNETKSQDGMREIVAKECEAKGLKITKVSIFQWQRNGDYGVAVGYDGDTAVAVAAWERTKEGSKTTYKFQKEISEKFDFFYGRL